MGYHKIINPDNYVLFVLYWMRLFQHVNLYISNTYNEASLDLTADILNTFTDSITHRHINIRLC